MNLLTKSLAEAAIKDQQRQQEEATQRDIDIKIKIISAGYDRAIAYTNLITLAGYAGIFTTWSLSKDFLPEFTAILIGLLLGISLFIFCSWEVTKMVHASFELDSFNRLLQKKLTPHDFITESQRVELTAQKATLKLHLVWKFVLVTTIVFGFGAALILFYNFLANLTGLPYWPK